MTTAYCTIAQIKTSLNIAGSQDDTLLTRIALSCSDWLDRHCNVPSSGFQPSSSTRYYSSASLDRDGDLVLDVPLLELTSLTDGAGISILIADAQLFPINGSRKWRVHLKTADWQIASSEDRVAVTGKFGFSLTPSEAIVEAATMLSCWVFKRYQAALQDNAVSPELGTVIYGSAMPKQVVELLKPFRLGSRLL